MHIGRSAFGDLLVCMQDGAKFLCPTFQKKKKKKREMPTYTLVYTVTDYF